jgi:hypothetical protein
MHKGLDDRLFCDMLDNFEAIFKKNRDYTPEIFFKEHSKDYYISKKQILHEYKPLLDEAYKLMRAVYIAKKEGKIKQIKITKKQLEASQKRIWSGIEKKIRHELDQSS